MAVEPFDLIRAAAHCDPDRARESWRRAVRSHESQSLAVRSILAGPGARLVPLIGARADELELDASTRGIIDRVIERTARDNDRILVHVGPLISGMIARGVEVMALKGAALLGDVYPERRLRRLGDVDLLVQVRDLDAAIGMLTTCGYSVPRATGRALTWGVHAVNVANDSRTSVDLHVRPAHAFIHRPGAPAAAWASAEAIHDRHPLAKVGLLRPSPAEHALVLGAHLARPAHQQIVHPWVDLHFLLTRQADFSRPETGQALLAAARRERISLRLASVLSTLSRELDTLLPISVDELTAVGARERRLEEDAIATEERFARYQRGANGGLRKLRDLSRIPTTGEGWRSRMTVAAGELVATLAVHSDGLVKRHRNLSGDRRKVSSSHRRARQ